MINYGNSAEEYLNSVSFQKRIKTVFSRIDVSNDGFLGLDDYLTFGDRMVALQKDGKNKERILTNCRDLYILVVCGGVKGKDDVRVTYDELLKNVANEYVCHEHAAGLLSQFAVLMFDIIDADHDGSISGTEFRHFHEVIGRDRVSKEFSDIAFASIDSDKDGVISRQEFSDAIVRYNLEVGGNDDTMPLVYGPLLEV